MTTWREYEIPDDANPPAGYHHFQTAYLDNTTKEIQSFTSGDFRVDKYLADDYLSIKYLREYVAPPVPTQQVAMNFGIYSYYSNNSLAWSFSSTTFGDYFAGTIGYSTSCGCWFAAHATKIYRSVDRITWTDVHTFSGYVGEVINIVSGATNEVMIHLASNTIICYSTNGGTSFTESTYPYSFGCFGGFYMDGKYWGLHQKPGDSYAQWWLSEMTSISNPTIVNEYSYSNAVCGTKPDNLMFETMDNGSVLILANANGVKTVVSSISVAPSSNNWSGTQHYSSTTYMYNIRRFAGTSTSNWMIVSAGDNFSIGSGERVVHSSGTALEIPGYMCYYDRDAAKWYYLTDTSFDSQYLLKETVDLSSSTTKSTTGITFESSSARVYFR